MKDRLSKLYGRSVPLVFPWVSESNIAQSQAKHRRVKVKIIHRRGPYAASGALTTVWSSK